MTATERDTSNLRFSTEDWPEGERRRAVWDLCGRTLWAADYEPLQDGPIYIDGRFRLLPGLGVADVTCSGPRRARRTREHLCNDYLLSILVCGTATLNQLGREVTISTGEAALTSGAESGVRCVSASRFVAFRLPARAITPLVPNIEDRVARPISRRNPALQLLTSYASMLYDSRAMATPPAIQLAVKNAYDLVALALSQSENTTETARIGGARAARLAAIKADIRENLGSDLSIGAVAARHRLPLRYLQRLFESEGTSFTNYVVEQRLLRAHHMLTSPRHADQPIGVIAFESGFGHLPYFNRAFRARFGATPSDIRARAMH